MIILRQKNYGIPSSDYIQGVSDTAVSGGAKHGLSDKTQKAMLDYEVGKKAGKGNFHKVYNKNNKAFKKSKKVLIPTTTAIALGTGIAIKRRNKHKEDESENKINS